MSNVLKKTFNKQNVTLKVLKREAWSMFMKAKLDFKEETWKVLQENKDLAKLCYAYGRMDNMDGKQDACSEGESMVWEGKFSERCEKSSEDTPFGKFVREYRDEAALFYLYGAQVSFVMC